KGIPREQAGDGASTLFEATGTNVDQERAQKTAEVDAVVLVKLVIFYGDKSVLYHLGHFGQGDGYAVFAPVQTGDFTAVHIVNIGRHFGIERDLIESGRRPQESCHYTDDRA